MNDLERAALRIALSPTTVAYGKDSSSVLIPRRLLRNLLEAMHPIIDDPELRGQIADRLAALDRTAGRQTQWERARQLREATVGR